MIFKRKDTFQTVEYKGCYIHSHYEYDNFDGSGGREVIQVRWDDPNVLPTPYRSHRGAKCAITRALNKAGPK